MAKETVEPKDKEVELTVSKAESDAVIVIVNGWRMRVYKEVGNKSDYNKGQKIVVSYTGDIDEPQTVKFEKLK